MAELDTIRAHKRNTQALRTQTVLMLMALWQALRSHRDADATQFAREAANIVTGAQRQAAAMANAYVSQILSDMMGEPPRPGEIQPATYAELRDHDPERPGPEPSEVYQRPFRQIWNDLSEGKPYDQAVKEAGDRVEKTSLTDLQLAARRAARERMGLEPDVTFYRRVLVGEENCGLCALASTQRYHKRDLLPIHPGCDCAVAPILSSKDPGRVIDSAVLSEGQEPTDVTDKGVKVYRGSDTLQLGDLGEEAHRAIEERFGVRDAGGRAIDYRKAITVRNHGEYGPTLTVSRHLFTGQDDIS